MRKKIRLMEVCGTHTMSIARYGIKRLLPHNVELISGPGCPVCVTPEPDIDNAISISREKDVIMTTFGDMMKVPGSRGSLEDSKREGADVRIVYSCLDALNAATANPGKKIVFMGVGFETTSPTVASTIKKAKREKVKNFFVLSNFKLVFPALRAIAASKKVGINGFICPGHVSVVTGSEPYETIARHYKKPCVIMGFEAYDIIKGIIRLLELLMEKKYDVNIAYERAVTRKGNTRAQKVLDSVFEVSDSEWRGLGVIKASGLSLKRPYKEFDAMNAFSVKAAKRNGKKSCICGDILKGLKSPRQCKMFKKACTPERPIGPCMVSSEGTCAAYYKYGG